MSVHHSFSLEIAALWRILVVSLVFGAGLPILFSAGIRAMAWGTGGDAEVSHEQPHPLGPVLAFVCFGVVLLCVALGLVHIVASGFGKQLSFENVYPTIVEK